MSFTLGLIASFAAPPGAGGCYADRDDLGERMRAWGGELELGLPFASRLRLDRPERLQPDGLIEALPALRKLWEARGEVATPSVMRALLAEAGIELEATPTATPPPSRRTEPEPAPDDAGLLDALLGGEPTPRAREGAGAADPGLARLIDAIGSEARASGDPEQEARWRDAIDAALSERVAAVVCSPAYSARERAWRSAGALVRAARTGEPLRILLLDREQLAAAPPADLWLALDLDAVEHAPALAELGARTAAPVVAGADAALCSALCDSDEHALRAPELAQWLALAHPGTLLRAPFGSDEQPVSGFSCQPRTPPLWASGALAVGLAVLDCVATHGDLAALSRHAQLEDLPLWIDRSSGAPEAVGPAETLLNEREIEKLRGAGIIPVVGFASQDRVALAALRTLSGAKLGG